MFGRIFMEIIGNIFLISLAVSTIGSCTEFILTDPPINNIDNCSLLPDVRAHRNGPTIVLEHLRGKTINKPFLLINGFKTSFAPSNFSIGDSIEFYCQNQSTIELYDKYNNLLFFAII